LSIDQAEAGRSISTPIPSLVRLIDFLMRRPILNHTKRGESVYEPLLGSGTTLAAAELTERTCYGLEIDPKYIDTVITRWQNLTGGKATLEG
jgi:DNA modification methylase